MKKLVPMALLAFSLSAISAPFGGLVRLGWFYPAADMGPELNFNIFTSTTGGVPGTNWTLLAIVIGTNLTALVPAVPGRNYYSATASNTINQLESTFSGAAEINVPRPPVNLNATKP